MIDTAARLRTYPFPIESELQEAANKHGYRIGPEYSGGWVIFRSASAPGEIAVAATADGMAGPFFLSVQHPGAAREFDGQSAGPPVKGHARAFGFASRDDLFVAVSAIYRLSISLPTLPYEDYLRDTATLGDTEADQVQKVRIGQSRFRDALMDYWNRTCPLTGITDTALLRASHIIPWAKCGSDQERLDVHNGLLLSALWDSAFDAGLITFSDSGHAIASPKLGDVARKALRLDVAMPLTLSADHKDRMAWHRANVWKA
jgi:putative restriction endonuclease